MSSTMRTVESICIPPRPGHDIFPEKRNFSATVALCKKMKDVTSVVDSQETQTFMTGEVAKYEG